MFDVSSLRIAIDTRDALTAKNNLDNLDKSVNKLDNSASKVSRGFLNFKSTVVGLATSLTIGKYVELSDTITNMDSRLRLATKSTEEFSKAQSELFELSQRTRTSFASNVELYSKLAVSTESLNLSQEKLLKVTEAISQAGIIGGGSKESINAALIQLGQGLASGTLRGEELNSVLEQTPRLARAIAEGMGVEVGALRSLAEQGMITNEVVINSLISQSDNLKNEFNSMDKTISQSMTVLGNSIMATLKGINQATGASSSLADAIHDIAMALSENKEAIVEFSQYFGAYFGKNIDLFNLFVQAARDSVEYVLGALNTIVYGTLSGIAQASLKATQALNAVGLSSDETLSNTTRFANEMARQFENATSMMTGAGRDVVEAWKDFNVSIEDRILLMQKEQKAIEEREKQQLKSAEQIKKELELKKLQEKEAIQLAKELERQLDTLATTYIDLARIGMNEYEQGLYGIALQTQKWIENGVSINDALEKQAILVQQLNEEMAKSETEANNTRMRDRLEGMRAEYDLKEKQIGLLDDENEKNRQLAILYNERQKKELEAKLKMGEISSELYNDSLDYEDKLLSKSLNRYSETGQIIEAVGNTMESSMMDFFDHTSKGFMDMKSLANNVLNSILQQIIKMSIVNPLVQGATSWAGGLFANAQGGVYSSPSLSNYSNQVHSSPKLFAFAQGGVPNMGVFGEAGSEAIMPLTRTPDGDLGVRALGTKESQNVKVEIINQSGEKMEVTNARSRNDIEGQIISIVINALNTNKGGLRTAMGGR